MMTVRLLPVATLVLLCHSAGASYADDMKVGGTGAAQGMLLRLSEAFHAAHPGDRVEVVQGLGSSGAIAALVPGVLQLAVSGRALKAEEKAQGLQSAPFLNTPFVFVTSHPNPQRLSKADVVAIHNGALAKWPDGKEIKPILRPKSDSATAFLIANFDGMQAAMDKLRQRVDVSVAATDQDNTEAAVRVPNSLAGATLVQLLTERSSLRIIALDGIEPSVAAMEQGAYSLKMRMDVVMKSEPTPVARRFAQFLRSAEAAKLIRENGGALLPAQTASTR